MKSTRREMLTAGGRTILAAAIGRSGLDFGSEFEGEKGPKDLAKSKFSQPLRVPPILSPVRSDATTDYYEITQKEADVEFMSGIRTRIWVYEGMFPGPTIKARRGHLDDYREKIQSQCEPGASGVWPGGDLASLEKLHPAYVHLVNFQILERNGEPPKPWERGWKDTVSQGKGEEVKIIMRFDGHRGRYLIHCHNLEHEDHNMVARFDVV